MKESLKAFINEVRKSLGSFNFFYNATILLFVKFVIDNPKLFINKEPHFYEIIYDFADKFRRAENGQYILRREDFSAILNPIDTLEEGTIFDDKLFAKMAYDLSDMVSSKTSTPLIVSLDHIDLKNVSEKQAVEMFEYLLANSLGDVNKTGSFTTNKELRQIVAGILDVKETDTFFNCFAGYSTILLSIQKPEMYIAFDINKEAILISKLLTMMLGFKNVRVLDINFVSQSFDVCVANKAFSDAPLGMRYEESYSKTNNYFLKTKDPNIISIYNTIDLLEKDGVAVIAVGSKVLTSIGKYYREIRRELATSGLEAVIELPPLWTGTGAQTNLLVVKKGYKGNISFISACQNIKNKHQSLTDDDVSEIIDAYQNKKNINQYSVNVDRRDVICADTFAISKYIIPKLSSPNHRDIKDIDDELSDLYSRLYNNLKE